VALTATITSVTRSDLTLNIEVLYTDPNASFTERRVLNISTAGMTDPATGRQIVLAAIQAQGQQFKQALAAYGFVSGVVGQPTGTNIAIT
jgi:hypothetical protein